MGALDSLRTAIDRLNRWVGSGVRWLALAMVLVGAFNAVARYMGRFLQTSLSSNSYIELQWYMFSALFLLGAGYTLQRDGHVRVDVLYDRLSDRKKAWVDFIGTLVFLLPFCCFALWVSLPMVVDSWQHLESSPDAGGLPRYPIKTLIPIAWLLLILQGLSLAISKGMELFGPPTPQESQP